MGAIDNLKAELISEAAKVVDTITRLACLADIDDWAAVRAALLAFSGSDIQSYTIAGRTFSKKNTGEMERRERAVYGRILTALYGSGAQVDARGLDNL